MIRNVKGKSRLEGRRRLMEGLFDDPSYGMEYIGSLDLGDGDELKVYEKMTGSDAGELYIEPIRSGKSLTILDSFKNYPDRIDLVVNMILSIGNKGVTSEDMEERSRVNEYCSKKLAILERSSNKLKNRYGKPIKLVVVKVNTLNKAPRTLESLY